MLKQQQPQTIKNQASELNDFLLSLDTYSPTVSENLVHFYLERSGLDIQDKRIDKLVSLATDKLLSEILYEAKQVANLRQQNGRSKKRKLDASEGVDIEDLQISLMQLRIFVKRRKLLAES